MVRRQNMTTPVAAREKADLSRLAALDKTLRKALEDQKTLEAFIDTLKADIKAEMGDAEIADINGVTRYTWGKTTDFAWAKFAEAHPEVAKEYRKWDVKEVLDTARVLAEHAALAEPFRKRQFLVK